MLPFEDQYANVRKKCEKKFFDKFFGGVEPYYYRENSVFLVFACFSKISKNMIASMLINHIFVKLHSRATTFNKGICDGYYKKVDQKWRFSQNTRFLMRKKYQRSIFLSHLQKFSSRTSLAIFVAQIASFSMVY